MIEIENSVIPDIRGEVCSIITKAYDDLILTMLYPYGIDRTNWKEQINRVEIVEQSHIYKHVLVDGVYAFTIESVPELITEWEKESTFKVEVGYVVKVYDELKGEGIR